MPRPRKRRRLSLKPQPAIFKPVGIPLESVDQVTLLHEELEALRLADLHGMTQEDAAAQMGVSRSTFQRMVTEARRKVAQALVSGWALEIAGGTFRVIDMRRQCEECGHVWDVTHGSGQGRREACPVCGSDAIQDHESDDISPSTSDNQGTR